MTTNATCPHCGAEISYPSISDYSHYKCGALVWGDGSTSYAECECLKRQIAKLKKEIDTMWSTLVHIAEHGGTTDDESGLSHNGSWCAEQARCALEKVK